MKLYGLAHVRDRLAAARVLQHRGMVDLLRPDEAVRAFLALRRYGAFGGLLAHTADRYGDAPAITDERGTLSFRELDQNSNALARALAAKGIRAGAVVAALHRNGRHLMTTVGAANKLGVRLVLMNSGFAGPQLADVAAREQVRCILTDDEFRDGVAAGHRADRRRPIRRVDRESIDVAAAGPAAPGRDGAADQRHDWNTEGRAALRPTVPPSSV